MGDGGRISRTRSSLGRGEGRTGIQGKSCMQPGQRRPGREARCGAVQTEPLVLASSASNAHVIPCGAVSRQLDLISGLEFPEDGAGEKGLGTSQELLK